MQRLVVVLGNFGGCRLLQKAVDFFLEFFEVLLFGFVLFLLDVGLVAVGGSDALGHGLALEAS